MKNYFLSILSIGILLCASCGNKCYECTKGCGTCRKGLTVVAGCNGDAALNGFSVDSWKLFLESDGYTCEIDPLEEEVCEVTDKESLEANNYKCVTK